MPTSVVTLPGGIRPPFQVYVNGVLQQPGVDYQIRGGELHFNRHLAKEGRLGPWRWFIGAFGIGTYRQNDSVDIRYEVEGRPMVAQGLDINSS